MNTNTPSHNTDAARTPAARRRRIAVGAGVLGAVLEGVAGLIQLTLGAVIPDWTGDKLAPVGLGLLTVGLAALALLSALRLRQPGLSGGVRAAWALGLAGPGLVCLSTVGVLAWLPGVLLVGAGVLAVVDGWRASVSAIAANWVRVLLSALGGCVLLMAAGAAVLPMIVGGVGGTALIVGAWVRPGHPLVFAALVLLGTVPFAVVGWAAVVPLLVVVLAVPLALAVRNRTVR
jgi:hypothetical protein